LSEDRSLRAEDWQRLDKWLWCARFMKARSDCARLVAGGMVRINRQPTDKPHARLRPGDVVTLPLRGDVRVLRVLALATRRGPAPEARLLYEELDASPGLRAGGDGVIPGTSPAAEARAAVGAEDAIEEEP
jgi:ribosome-associated heat shock protein Hsp15